MVLVGCTASGPRAVGEVADPDPEIVVDTTLGSRHPDSDAEAVDTDPAAAPDPCSGYDAYTLGVGQPPPQWQSMSVRTLRDGDRFELLRNANGHYGAMVSMIIGGVYPGTRANGLVELEMEGTVVARAAMALARMRHVSDAGPSCVAGMWGPLVVDPGLTQAEPVPEPVCVAPGTLRFTASPLDDDQEELARLTRSVQVRVSAVPPCPR